MKHPSLVPAVLATTCDGTPFSVAYDDLYHSAHGGLAQSRHVFIHGNDLPSRWQHAVQHNNPFVIAETGFGLGLNFLATWQAWQIAGQPCRLHFVSFEKHPFSRKDLARALAGFAELEMLVSQLINQWPPLVNGFHRLHFENSQVTLTLIFGDAQTQLPRLVARLDALYLDGFAPAKNPELWSPALLATFTRLCHPSATLATWSVAGELRRTLETLGWMLARRPGFGNKREMLVGHHSAAASFESVSEQGCFPETALHFLQPDAKLCGISPSATAGIRNGEENVLCSTALLRRGFTRAFLARPPCSASIATSAGFFPASSRCTGSSSAHLEGSTRIKRAPTFMHGERKALVIGAGLAGTAISERLAQRGWQVDLFERNAAPAQEASGNPSGVLLPLLAKDDALAARLSRACYLYALRRLNELPNVRWSPCGVLHIARNTNHEFLQCATVHELNLPVELVSFLDRAAAEALIGRPLAHGGWWFPAGGWVDPSSLCNALLAAGGERIRTHYSVEVARLEQAADGWQIFDSTDNLLGSAPHLILANAQAAEALLPCSVPLTLMPIRGQISYLTEPAGNDSYPPLRHALCRSGYLTPPESGTICVGASFDSGDSDLQSRLSDHKGNLQRLEELLPGATQGIDACTLTGRVGIRSTTRDRVPLIGALPAPLTAKDMKQATLATLPRIPGLHVFLGLGARGMVWAPLAAELLASQLANEPLPLEQELINLTDPARFYLHALRRNQTIIR
ncbi:MAG: FAD-dependent 5-carboxymethylaminomethyl-2-thiouridine(34) oxidoreductase MnmC [Rugosibacter sp.]|nr:FAD-dependent 5-carboxymethylaminomethyl-2-thiouridine(34) oxidoreductase MnmC [Rugosibacter sp.]